MAHIRRRNRGFVWAARALLVALAVATSAFCVAKSRKRSTMDESQQQLLTTMQTLGVDAYVRKDDSSVSKLPTRALEEGVRGLLLSAPPSLDGRTVRPVPGLLLMARSQVRTDALPFRTSAVVVATDLDRGGSYAGPAFVVNPSKVPHGVATEDKPAPAPAPARPVRSPEEQARLDAMGHGDSAALLWFDFRQLLALPKESSRYLLRVIDFDDVSNPAPVQVTMLPASPEGVSPEAAEAVVTRSRDALAHGQPGPRFGRDAKTPPLAGPGAALAFGEISWKEGARRVPVHGVFRLELTRAMLVTGLPKGADARAPAPRAVVRASVLVLMERVAQPMHTRVEIPIFADHELHAGEVVEGAFAVDLSTALPLKPRPGAYMAYLFAGPHLAGPHPLIVSGE